MRILKFFGTWCNPCKALGKILEEANIQHEAIDVDENEELVEKYHIRSVPTLVVLNDADEEVKRITGVQTKEQLLKELNNYVESK